LAGIKRRSQFVLTPVPPGEETDYLLLSLGLVLFHIRAGRPTDYGTGESELQQAKNTVLSMLHLLDRRMSSLYACLVHRLLTFGDHSPSSQDSEVSGALDSDSEVSKVSDEFENKMRYLVGVFSDLRKLSNDLKNTIANPLPGPDIEPARKPNEAVSPDEEPHSPPDEVTQILKYSRLREEKNDVLQPVLRASADVR
jgi:hypothetical protein